MSHSAGANRAYNRTAVGAFTWHFRSFMLWEKLKQNTNKNQSLQQRTWGLIHFSQWLQKLQALATMPVALTEVNHTLTGIATAFWAEFDIWNTRTSSHQHIRIYHARGCSQVIFYRHITQKLLAARTWWLHTFSCSLIKYDTPRNSQGYAEGKGYVTHKSKGSP